MKWGLVYEKAIREDGTPYFPQKLGLQVLEDKKRAMGSYIFANQYLNEIIPAELQCFKKDWFTYYDKVPERTNTFMFVDPAISQADTADFTGVVVVSVDVDKRWYVRYARRHKITPTEIINILFSLNNEFRPNIIGIEDVAYQKALLYFLDEEMRRRNVVLPVKGIRPPTDKTKEMRILSLVPRFEFGRMLLNRGLTDLELELLKFPRGSHDDLSDALAGIEYIYYPPSKEQEWARKPASNDPKYEAWFIQNLRKGENGEGSEESL
jgi:predicted phage terminase large subunit-like protein